MRSAVPHDPCPRLPRSFYHRDTVTVARSLLGQRLVSIKGGRSAGLIVETEAYLGVRDKASHTYGGRRTARNDSMWGDGGHAYVYFVYGVHHCVNAVAGYRDSPRAVLIRALEPQEGLDRMFERRARAKRPADLCSGPGKLCQALAVDRDHNGVDLVTGRSLFIEQVRRRAHAATRIGVGPRIGVGYAGEWKDEPLRFWLRGNPHVSR